MKRITLIRHAKSSWKSPGLTDFDRPLNKRGLRAAPIIGDYLKEHNIPVDVILSSPANRAQTTAKIIASKLDYQEDKIVFENSLYNFSDEDAVLDIIQLLDDDYQNIIVFGHNPTFTFLANKLSDHYFDNIPTCGVTSFELAIDEWAKVYEAKSVLSFYIFPKMLSDDL